jgi:hypothetical protein
VSSIWLPVCVAVAAVTTTMISGVVYLKAQRQRYAAEQLCLQVAERLAASHGPEVLAHLPPLVRELREAPESAAAAGRPRKAPRRPVIN